jgi:hypothetical protein
MLALILTPQTLNHLPMNSNEYTLANGITGVLASATGFLVTWMQQIETWVRFSTAILCLLIAIITLYNLLRGKKQ